MHPNIDKSVIHNGRNYKYLGFTESVEYLHSQDIKLYYVSPDDRLIIYEGGIYYIYKAESRAV